MTNTVRDVSDHIKEINGEQYFEFSYGRLQGMQMDEHDSWKFGEKWYCKPKEEVEEDQS